MQIAFTQECYPNSLLPKMFYPSNDSWSGYHYALEASEAASALFSGGYTTKDGGKAFILAVDFDTSRTMWRRFFWSDSMDTVTALAASPDG